MFVPPVFVKVAVGAEAGAKSLSTADQRGKPSGKSLNTVVLWLAASADCRAIVMLLTATISGVGVASSSPQAENQSTTISEAGELADGATKVYGLVPVEPTIEAGISKTLLRLRSR